MYVLDPEHHYAREQERVLRLLANWIAGRGFCPEAKVFAKHHRLNPKVLNLHLEDLLMMDEVELCAGKVWAVTRKGFARIKKQYTAPILPPSLHAKKPAQIMSTARRMARELNDPEVFAAFEAHMARKSPETHARILAQEQGVQNVDDARA